VFSTAKVRQRVWLNEQDVKRSAKTDTLSGTGTVAQLVELYRSQIEGLPIGESSKKARLVGLKKLLKTWPELMPRRPQDVTTSEVQSWAARFRSNGTQFKPKGASKVWTGNSQSSFNKAIDALKSLFAIGVEAGAINQNPVRTKGLKHQVGPKRIHLPSLAQFHAVFSEIEQNSGKGGWGLEIADFCRLMAYSGARRAEAAAITWGDVHFDRKELDIRGTKSATSKRTIPMFAPLESLLQKIAARRTSKTATEQVARVGKALISLKRACLKVGVPALTHHDLRHFFATICIESGVQIPTLSRWLGHADGGMLALRTYGHLRDEHAKQQASLVKF
jgi:integrase